KAPYSLSGVAPPASRRPRSSHAVVWIYGQRVPIVVWAPDVIDPQDHVERVMLADLAPTTADDGLRGGLAAIRSEAHAVNVVDIHREGGSRNAGPAEREKLARLFGTIGNATAGSRPSRSDPRVLGSARLTGIGT